MEIIKEMAEVIPEISDLLREATNSFQKKFGYKPEKAACGPGRVNLIGEHTDYNDGFVFPMVSNNFGLTSYHKTGALILAYFESKNYI